MDKMLACEQPREVDVGCIERELRRMWMNEGPGVVRTCAMNLAVVLWQRTEVGEVEIIMRRVADTNPARVILITADPESPAELRSWIAAQCRAPQGSGARVCQELIRLNIHGNQVQHVDNVLFSIFAPDLPTFLWWIGGVPDDPVAQRALGNLLERCDRIVLDTLRLTDPLLELVAMALHVSSPEQRAALGDLNWHRLTPWRQVIAQTFDPPEMRPALFSLDRVEVACDCADSPTRIPVQVLLLMGWLASRLGWRSRGTRGAAGEQVVVDFERKDGGAVVLHLLCHVGPVVHHSRIQSVRMTAPGTALEALLRGETELESVLEVDGRPPLRRVVAAHTMDLFNVLQRELGIMGRNPVYEQALIMAERLGTLAMRASLV